MRQLFRIYIPSAAIIYTLTMLVVAIVNLILGCPHQSNWFAVELMGFIIGSEVIDAVLSKIPFKTRIGYLIADYIAMYALLLIIAYFGFWFHFDAWHLILSTVLFALFSWLLHRYYGIALKIEADEINQKLKK